MELINSMSKLNTQYYYNQDRREAKRFYNSKAWETCRHMALRRDYYLCQYCLDNKFIKVYDVVHHIKPRRDYPELALDIDNLISLCHTCHGIAESNTKQISNKINAIEFGGNEEIF